jgi:hypothetical protein
MRRRGDGVSDEEANESVSKVKQERRFVSGCGGF